MTDSAISNTSQDEDDEKPGDLLLEVLFRHVNSIHRI